MLTPEPYYRNASCKAMAERIANPTAVETLDVKLRADQILQDRRSEEFQEKLAECLKNRLPFILYEDETRFGHGNYYLIIPTAMKMVCYMDRQVRAETVSTTVNSFLNNLHLAIAAYDKIWVPEAEGRVLLLT